MLSRAATARLKSLRPADCHWIWVRLLSSRDVRSKFIEYFEGQGHHHYPSSSVIPKKGDGTYFTNAGMNQFKPLFLGQCDPSSKLWDLKRAVNSQKCIRVGGKHNDLEDVGYDLTHHTFFEMMGNWSFGDYFKKETCQMAYELLTQHLSIPEDRLYFTYFGGDKTMDLAPDEECFHIWADLGIPRDRILPFSAKDNFWDMGVTGPCGPCTEIHYDHIGGRHAGSEVNTGSPDVVEIWNLVFMQYNRHVNQSLTLLPSHHVDTGMGLERMTAVLNGFADNYRTDLFMPLFDIIQQTAKCGPYQSQLTREDTAYRILSDHCRMLTVAISDGLLPSNDNLGHKVRIILHKCIQLCRRHFHADPHILLPAIARGVVASLGDAYPELSHNQGKVIDVISSAIDYHDKTMEQATRNFKKMISRVSPTGLLSGDVIQALEKGHFGSAMALETIVEMANSHGMNLDMEGYQRLVQAESKHSAHSPHPSSSVQSPIEKLVDLLIEQGKPVTNQAFKYEFSTPDGVYDFSMMSANTCPCVIQCMMGYQEQTDHRLEGGQKGEIILDKTCFYAEAGGQEADKGYLHSQTGTFEVDDVQNYRGYVVHSGYVTRGHLISGQNVTPEISIACREGNMRNHTGTHLLNSALLHMLPTTQQEGSSISSHRFSFDFLALSKVEDVEHIQSRVKDIIREGHPVTCTEMTLTEAKQDSRVGWNQNEDYPNEVRVVSIGSSDGQTSVSKELCGGTHVLNTAHLGDFCITGLNAKSQHVQRVTCVTGPQAVQAHHNGMVVDSMCSLLQQLHTCVQGKTDVQAVVDETHVLTSRAKQVQVASLKKADFTDVIEKTKEDIEKMLTILNSLFDDLRPLEANPLKSEGYVGVMKQLVDRIHQCQHLELLPKTVRNTTHASVQEMEHRVQALVNAGKAASLKKALTKIQVEGCNAEPNFVTVDPDMNPRQVLKVITKQPILKPAVLLQDGKTGWNVVLNIPCQSGKSNPEQDLQEFLKVLQTVGSAKGKVAIRNSMGFVLKCSVKGRNLENIESCVRQWWDTR